jgi:hypothetical protein
MDLFPFTKARLSDVPYRNSQLGPDRSPDDLRQNMLRVVFGWENDIEELVRDERKSSNIRLMANPCTTNIYSGSSPIGFCRSSASFQMARRPRC